MGSEILASHSVTKRPNTIPDEIADLHAHCGIFTQDSTARSMLGKIGWIEDQDLSRSRLLDPCIGEGAFLVPAVATLIASLKRTGAPLNPETLAGRILGVEIHGPALEKARDAVWATLMRMGVDETLARWLPDTWLRNEDFLLRDFRGATFTHVVANPPYLRWKGLPPTLSATYRAVLPKAWTTGDLSVAFIAKMIDLTADGGRLAILSTDRWMHAAHAERFREHWLPKVHIQAIEKVNAHEVFQAPVATYPVIAIMTRANTAEAVRPPALQSADVAASAIVEDWMSRFPPLVQAGCEIRVGPALGHEEAFVGRALDVEEALLLPYLRPRGIVGDGLVWGGDRVLSVHAPGRGLIDLRHYPRAAGHLERFRGRLEGRACVKGDKGAERWYRTIDRVDRAIWARDKIVLPEIFSIPRIALDQEGHVPAHSIYTIFSASWPLPILRDLLAAGVLGMVMECIAPRIGGGCKRCYKRFLSRLPLPHWDTLPEETRLSLAACSAARNRVGFSELVAGIYGVETDLLWQYATRDWRGCREGEPIAGDDGGQARGGDATMTASTQKG